VPMKNWFCIGQQMVAGLLLLIGGGCSMLAPGTQQLSISASEDDAKIYVNGDLGGTGRAKVIVPRNQTISVLVKKDGFYPSERTIHYTLSNTGIADLVGGSICLFPLVGLLSPGAQRLSEENVSIILQPMSKPPNK